MSELLGLLEVGAVAARFGIDQDALPRLSRWMLGAGIRWGLNDAHRRDLGLAACGDQNSAWFGLRRMLFGYATGTVGPLEADAAMTVVAPYTDIGGLEAELAGSLAHLLQALTHWVELAAAPAPPEEWAERCRTLLAALFKAESIEDKQALRALEDGLTAWQLACEQASFSGSLSLPVVRSAWLEAIDLPGLNPRFKAGGVTFCTLMPMRAIPFEVVCLLGMNDGDYPRRGKRSDFDLMGLAGMGRPGDRSRRDDDRQLMLEALLSARRGVLRQLGWPQRARQQPPAALGLGVPVARLPQRWPGPNGWLDAPPSTRFNRSAAVISKRNRPCGPMRSNGEVRHGTPIEPEAVSTTEVAAFVPDPRVPLDARPTGPVPGQTGQALRQRLRVAFEQDLDEDTDHERFTVDGLTTTPWCGTCWPAPWRSPGDDAGSSAC